VLSLPELQRRIAAAILDPGSPGIATAPALPIRGNVLSQAQRLQIYRNSLFESATSALTATYPVIRRLVGDNFFRHVSRRYLQACPSTSPDLRDLGRRLPEFLEGFGSVEGLPYLPDVARLEWACQEALHAVALSPVDAAALAALDVGAYARIGLRFNPACRLLRSRFPIVRIWEANQPGEAQDRIDLSLGEARGLVSRPEWHVEVRQLGRGEFVLLSALAKGRSVAESAERGLRSDPDLDVAVALAAFLSRGVFVEIQTVSGDRTAAHGE
jgi:hypothetical protein